MRTSLTRAGRVLCCAMSASHLVCLLLIVAADLDVDGSGQSEINDRIRPVLQTESKSKVQANRQ